MTTKDHRPLPVPGYTSQSTAKVDLAIEGKTIEETYLRWLDKLSGDPETDQRSLALARTNIEQGAMWAIRSIFKPTRFNGKL